MRFWVLGMVILVLDLSWVGFELMVIWVLVKEKNRNKKVLINFFRKVVMLLCVLVGLDSIGSVIVLV